MIIWIQLSKVMFSFNKLLKPRCKVNKPINLISPEFAYNKYQEFLQDISLTCKSANIEVLSNIDKNEEEAITKFINTIQASFSIIDVYKQKYTGFLPSQKNIKNE